MTVLLPYDIVQGSNLNSSPMKILKPITNRKNDAFRKLLDLWSERGLCELEHYQGDYCWFEKEHGILLYDFPRLHEEIPEFQYGLFANVVPNTPNISPWIFWARHPEVLESYQSQGRKSFLERTEESIFIGTIENRIQFMKRFFGSWKKYISHYSMQLVWRKEQRPRYTLEEYYELLSNARFGLCLPGYGPKCGREIEYMALGVVPLVTPGVDLRYYDPWIEDEHYLFVGSPAEIPEKIVSMSEAQWEKMSQACHQWYLRNASITGSFETTARILKSLSR